MSIEITYNGQVYAINPQKYISVHHQIVDLFYEKSIKFYERFMIEQKRYVLYDEKSCEEIMIDHVFPEERKEKEKRKYQMKIDFTYRDCIDMFLPYIKILLFSLFLTLRIDITFVSIGQIYCQAFEDYYCLLFYLFILFLLLSMIYGSYQLMMNIIMYICKNLDEDIESIMNIYGTMLNR